MSGMSQRRNVPLFFLALAGLIAILAYTQQASAQYNYDHVNVTVRVNITNALPEILNISIASASGNITLSAGSTRTVVCNLTVRDYNGFNDIVSVNATLYYYLNLSTQQDDRNEHYTNGSCTQTANDGSFIANYSCSFPVYYFANNGTWYCNSTVRDNFNFTDSDPTANTTFNALYALNVTDVIDYGNLSVTQTSDNITANVTNFGNLAINVSVLGYGRTQGDGVGLVCALGTNISVENQRFSSYPLDFTSKTQLSAVNQIMNLTVPRQLDDSNQVVNSTYWQLFVPPNPFGICNGTVRFTATIP